MRIKTDFTTSKGTGTVVYLEGLSEEELKKFYELVDEKEKEIKDKE
jgi:hypothetical protein